MPAYAPTVVLMLRCPRNCLTVSNSPGCRDRAQPLRDLKTYGLMKLAAQAVKSMCDLKDLKVHWTADVTAFDEALEAIARTLKAFRPHVLAARI